MVFSREKRIVKDMEKKRHAERVWLHNIPKVELHLHLEGAIPYEAMWELIRKYGGDPSVPTLDSLRDKFEYRSFPQFIDTWVWKNGFLREYDDFAFIAEEVARDLVVQNIRYVEAFFSPGDFVRHGLETQRIAESIRKGLSKIHGVEVSLVADLIRDFGPNRAMATLAEVNEVKELGIVGIGIGGSEQEFPPEPFAKVFEVARRMGFNTSAHAGEVVGPESIWGAVRTLRVDRIGHGASAAEDDLLLDFLKKSQIPLEMCPISNVRTGAIESIEAHPVRKFFDRGVVVTINTDDPKMFGNSLVDEFLALRSVFGFTRAQIRELTLQAVRVSWASESKKQQLLEEFFDDPGWEFDTAPSEH